MSKWFDKVVEDTDRATFIAVIVTSLLVGLGLIKYHTSDLNTVKADQVQTDINHLQFQEYYINKEVAQDDPSEEAKMLLNSIQKTRGLKENERDRLLSK
jgi:hypothetical protein